MGVQGLWDLLAPVGRRVSVETLSGKKLAIDASIWMVQFMKAMRDEKGEMVRNAHLLGFFRRICKLLYLRTKPVFVFDGATPALKRRTVIARRRQRENAQAKIRKTAEKLLLNHLKAMRLKELVKDLEEQRKKQGSDAKAPKVWARETDVQGSNLEKDNFVSESFDRENFDEMLAASIAVEEDQCLNSNASTSAATPAVGGPIEEEEDNEEMKLPEMDGDVDPSILAALPPSMQLDLLMRDKLMTGSSKNTQELKKVVGNENEKCKLNTKGKDILSDQTDMEEDDKIEDSYNQEKLDEMLAASIMADEDGSLTNKASTSAATFPLGEEDADEYEEIVLPAMHGRVDPAVLAALPPSMQLDLLVQMRERLMAENRKKYQKVKKAPEKFSELQIQAYLKTVAFRREINQLQKAASGKGVGGVQTSRIASEANREFIFSSSFTGDKQLLTSAEMHRHGEKQQQALKGHPASLSVDSAAFIGSNTITGFVQDEPTRVFDEDDVETYTDERGRTHISRVRAMGMRMTRDLQRNLDLMKEMEKENTDAIKVPSSEPELNNNTLIDPECHPSGKQPEKGFHGDNGDSVSFYERNAQSTCNYETSIQVSFEVDGKSKCLDSDDDMFACLLSGKPIEISSADKSTSRRQSSNSCSDSDWEEGIVEVNGNRSSNDADLGHEPPFEESNISDDSEVEWEEGGCEVHENSLVPDPSRKNVSRGHLEEEADLQEAIRRSLEDMANGDDARSEHKKFNVCRAVGFCDQEDSSGGKDASKLNKLETDILIVKKLDTVGKSNVCLTSASPQGHLKMSELPIHNNLLINEPRERDLSSNFRQSSRDWNKEGKLCSKMPSAELVTSLEAKEVNLIVEQSPSTFAEGRRQFASTKMCSGDAFHISKAASGSLPNAMVTDDDKNSMEAEPSMMVNEKIGLEAPPSSHSFEITDPSTSFVQQSTKDSESGIDCGEKLTWEKVPHDQLSEKHSCMGKSAPRDNQNVQINFSDARLEEEMLILGQEFVNLEDEQRKLERNAESVSSEMFAECQELLQMFGIPYIIAPMEAEAQCAYMEVANLVDGVVTDDSDVFLFGAQSVYKNIFDDHKYVETYLMKDIEKELGLTREKLIRMALLLGSDYTEGVSGIGIVNAIEVVNAFPEDDGLHKFREWIELPDPTILGKLDIEKGLNTRKKAPKVVDNDFNGASCSIEAIPSSDQNFLKAHENEHSAYQIQEMKQIFMDKHRNVSKNWHLPSSFPSGAVISAYSSPQVDRSTDPFTWAKPDLHVLRKLCWENFGWSIQKTDELLLPVLKEYDKRETQLRIEAFYTFNERFAKIRSKRIKKAVKGITGNQSSDLMDDPVEKVSKKRKRRMSPGKSGGSDSGKSKKSEETVPDELKTVERSSTKQSRKRSTGEPASYSVQTLEQKGQGGRMQAKKGSRGNGRARRRGTSLGTGQGRIKGSLHLEQSDSSSSDVGDIEHEVHTVNSKGQLGRRRSARSRKTVNYTEKDVETDDMEESEDWSDKERPDLKAAEQGLCCDQGSCGDATTGLDGEKQQKAKDPSGENLSPHYPERSGFCTGEAEGGQPAVSQNSVEVNDSEDYLKMGGGFCVDENGGGEDQDASRNPSAAPVRATTDSSSLCGFSEETEYGDGSVQSVSSMEGDKNELVDEGKTHVSVTEHNMNPANAHAGDPSEADGSMLHSAKSNGASRVGLHAMPFLKRKRRKI